MGGHLSFYAWAAVIFTLAIGIATWGVPILLAEVFPWQIIRKQRNTKITVNTKSYQGKTIMIIGANGVFGSLSARIFAERQVETLILADVKDCTDLKTDIEAGYPASSKKRPNILVWKVDMMSYSSCQEFARKANELKSLDHVLITAGILSYNRRVSPEGWENSIQINFISTALLAILLLPALRPSPTNPAPPVLSFTTSFGVYPSSPTMGVPKKGAYLKHLSNNRDGLAQQHQYGRSKALLLFFARELAARVSHAEARGFHKVTINSADPGSAWTPLTNPNQDHIISRLIMAYSARDPLICATALVNAVSGPANWHGQIVLDSEPSPYPLFMDRKNGLLAQERLWQETREEFLAKVPDSKEIYEILD